MKTIFRSKLAYAVLAVLLTAFGAGMAWATSTPASGGMSVPGMAAPSTDTAAKVEVTPARLELARKYIESVPVETDVKNAVEQLSTRINPDQRVLYRSLADSAIDYTKLREQAVQATAEIFTDEEIKAMTAFFSTPEGKSMRAKMPSYEARMQPIMTEAMQNFAVKLQQNAVTVMPDGGTGSGFPQ